MVSDALESFPAPTSPTKSTPVPTPSASPTKAPSFDYDAYKNKLAARESGGDYRAVNPKTGYLGKYQMGAMALETAGLLKSGASKTGTVSQVFNNPANWTLAGGKEAFLNDAALQERVMKDYTNRNRRSLESLKKLSPESSGQDVGAALAMAHLVGPGGTATSRDASGVTGGSYAQLGAASQVAAVRQAGPVEQLTAANNDGAAQGRIVAPVVNVVGGAAGARQHASTDANGAKESGCHCCEHPERQRYLSGHSFLNRGKLPSVGSIRQWHVFVNSHRNLDERDRSERL